MKRRKTKMIIIPDEDCKPVDKNQELIKNVKKLRRNNILSFGGKKQ